MKYNKIIYVFMSTWIYIEVDCRKIQVPEDLHKNSQKRSPES